MQKNVYEDKKFNPRIKDIELVYIGEGQKVGNVPTRDLNPREVILYGGSFYLVKTGLYVFPEQIKDDAGK